MRVNTRSTLIGAMTLLSVIAAAAAAPANEFTGNLVNVVGSARFNQPFTLGIDHYASAADLQQLAAALQTKGPYGARDKLWRKTAGYLSIGGRLGYPVAEVFAYDTPQGRSLYAVIDRPMRTFEVQYSTRSSKYPFSVVELNVDRSGKGDGTLIAAANLQVRGNKLEVKSLGVQPFRLLKVQPG